MTDEAAYSTGGLQSNHTSEARLRLDAGGMTQEVTTEEINISLLESLHRITIHSLQLMGKKLTLNEKLPISPNLVNLRYFAKLIVLLICRKQVLFLCGYNYWIDSTVYH